MKGADVAVAIELRDYFRTSESALGLASSWAPLVGIAMGGAVTSTSHEGKIVDGRFAFGARQTTIGKHREIRRALILVPLALDVLWAAYGPVPWPRVIDGGLGKGMAAKLSEHIDEQLLGVALLTPEVRDGSAAWNGPDRSGLVDLAWRAPGAWLVELSLMTKSRRRAVTEEQRAQAIAKLSEVGRSASRLLRSAEQAYSGVRGEICAPLARPSRPRRCRSLPGIELVELAGAPR